MLSAMEIIAIGLTTRSLPNGYNLIARVAKCSPSSIHGVKARAKVVGHRRRSKPSGSSGSDKFKERAAAKPLPIIVERGYASSAPGRSATPGECSRRVDCVAGAAKMASYVFSDGKRYWSAIEAQGHPRAGSHASKASRAVLLDVDPVAIEEWFGTLVRGAPAGVAYRRDDRVAASEGRAVSRVVAVRECLKQACARPRRARSGAARPRGCLSPRGCCERKRRRVSGRRLQRDRHGKQRTPPQPGNFFELRRARVVGARLAQRRLARSQACNS